jgi:hypothetical protein
MRRGRVIRMAELTPDAYLSLQERYRDLLAAFIQLGDAYSELMVKHHAVLEANLKGSKVTL